MYRSFSLWSLIPSLSLIISTIYWNGDGCHIVFLDPLDALLGYLFRCLWFNFFYICGFIRVYTWGSGSVMACVWRSEGNFQKLILFFHYRLLRIEPGY